MKRYYINVHYDAVCAVEVVAENEDEALEKAEELAARTEPRCYDFFKGESCVVDDTEMTPEEEKLWLAQQEEGELGYCR